MDELVGMGKGSSAFLRMDKASENRKMAELIEGSVLKVRQNAHQITHCNRMGRLRDSQQQCGMGQINVGQSWIERREKKEVVG